MDGWIAHRSCSARENGGRCRGVDGCKEEGSKRRIYEVGRHPYTTIPACDFSMRCPCTVPLTATLYAKGISKDMARAWPVGLPPRVRRTDPCPFSCEASVRKGKESQWKGSFLPFPFSNMSRTLFRWKTHHDDETCFCQRAHPSSSGTHKRKTLASSPLSAPLSLRTE